jgi:hypothetical protein
MKTKSRIYSVIVVCALVSILMSACAPVMTTTEVVPYTIAGIRWVLSCKSGTEVLEGKHIFLLVWEYGKSVNVLAISKATGEPVRDAFSASLPAFKEWGAMREAIMRGGFSQSSPSALPNSLVEAVGGAGATATSVLYGLYSAIMPTFVFIFESPYDPFADYYKRENG